VNVPAQRVRTDESQQPQHQENYKNRPEHSASSQLPAETATVRFDARRMVWVVREISIVTTQISTVEFPQKQITNAQLFATKQGLLAT